MSRIGKYPVALPNGVDATVDGQDVKVKGPKGELARRLVEEVSVEQADGALTVTPRQESKKHRQAWGLERSLLANMVKGVSDGFERRLEINGVGYRAAVQGTNLQLNLGFSHEVQYPIPKSLSVQCPRPTEIVISGIDKAEVGQLAANIRRLRPPEPYKGKGVKYAGETIVRKEGKKK